MLHLFNASGLLKQPKALFSYQKWPFYMFFYVHGRKFYAFLWIRDKFSIRIYDGSSTPARETQTNHKIISKFPYLNLFHIFCTGLNEALNEILNETFKVIYQFYLFEIGVLHIDILSPHVAIF